MRRVAAALLLAALLGGCGGDEDGAVAGGTSCGVPRLPPGEERVDLGDRWYLRAIPSTYDGSAPLPLVVDLHGYSEGATHHADITELRELGDEEGFVTVTPHAAGDVPAWDLDPRGADVAFVEEVLDDVRAHVCIDDGAVFATGSSMGGFLVSVLACELADRFAAVAPVAGVRAIPNCRPSAPVPMVAFHGTADASVLYDGGLNELTADALELPDTGPSIRSIATEWATRNGCDDRPTETAVEESVIIRFPCPDGADVVLRRIDGGRHEWPAGASDLIWAFFDAHRRR